MSWRQVTLLSEYSLLYASAGESKQQFKLHISQHEVSVHCFHLAFAACVLCLMSALCAMLRTHFRHSDRIIAANCAAKCTEYSTAAVALPFKSAIFALEWVGHKQHRTHRRQASPAPCHTFIGTPQMSQNSLQLAQKSLLCTLGQPLCTSRQWRAKRAATHAVRTNSHPPRDRFCSTLTSGCTEEVDATPESISQARERMNGCGGLGEGYENVFIPAIPAPDVAWCR